MRLRDVFIETDQPQRQFEALAVDGNSITVDLIDVFEDREDKDALTYSVNQSTVSSPVVLQSIDPTSGASLVASSTPSDDPVVASGATGQGMIYFVPGTSGAVRFPVDHSDDPGNL